MVRYRVRVWVRISFRYFSVVFGNYHNPIHLICKLREQDETSQLM